MSFSKEKDIKDIYHPTHYKYKEMYDEKVRDAL